MCSVVVPGLSFTGPPGKSAIVGFFFLSNFICFVFALAGSLLLHRLFSSWGEWRLLSSSSARPSHCSSFSCCRAQGSEHMGFSSCSTWV